MKTTNEMKRKLSIEPIQVDGKKIFKLSNKRLNTVSSKKPDLPASIVSIHQNLKNHNEIFDATEIEMSQNLTIMHSNQGRAAIQFYMKQGEFAILRMHVANATHREFATLFANLGFLCQRYGAEQQAVFSAYLKVSEKEVIRHARAIKGCQIKLLVDGNYQIKINLLQIAAFYPYLVNANLVNIIQSRYCSEETFESACEQYLPDEDNPASVHKYFGFCVVDENQQPYGGIFSKIIDRHLHIQWLALDPACRGMNFSKKLIGLSEQVAKAQGCQFAKVDTASFQAPFLYPSVDSNSSDNLRYIKIQRMPMGRLTSEAGLSKTVWGYDYLKRLTHEVLWPSKTVHFVKHFFRTPLESCIPG